ncbi:unnamed protein product [Linum tenue]|uniref:Uncharacterized protein n=1 Tax=Linum tenue TaxID=586396 RepID=A0AAV0K7P6_9ROSI|nr:unnamed protein product [Linum tenue]CAI0417450.1 unnamed protein product [Linum tenue]
MNTLVSPTGTAPRRCATAMAWIFQVALAEEQMDWIWRTAIGTYASYRSSTTVLPSKVSRVVPENVVIAPACGALTKLVYLAMSTDTFSSRISMRFLSSLLCIFAFFKLE